MKFHKGSCPNQAALSKDKQAIDLQWYCFIQHEGGCLNTIGFGSSMTAKRDLGSGDTTLYSRARNLTIATKLVLFLGNDTLTRI